MKAIGLCSRDVLARLKEGRPAYENMQKQHLNCQKAHCIYVEGKNLEEEVQPQVVLKPRGTQRTVKLTEKSKVVLAEKPARKTRSPNRVIRGSVARSLREDTIEFARRRLNKMSIKAEPESESSKSNTRKRRKKPEPKGCLNECKVFAKLSTLSTKSLK